jgi:hypothetical protein
MVVFEASFGSKEASGSHVEAVARALGRLQSCEERLDVAAAGACGTSDGRDAAVAAMVDCARRHTSRVGLLLLRLFAGSGLSINRSFGFLSSAVAACLAVPREAGGGGEFEIESVCFRCAGWAGAHGDAYGRRGAGDELAAEAGVGGGARCVSAAACVASAHCLCAAAVLWVVARGATGPARGLAAEVPSPSDAAASGPWARGRASAGHCRSRKWVHFRGELMHVRPRLILGGVRKRGRVNERAGHPWGMLVCGAQASRARRSWRRRAAARPAERWRTFAGSSPRLLAAVASTRC